MSEDTVLFVLGETLFVVILFVVCHWVKWVGRNKSRCVCESGS